MGMCEFVNRPQGFDAGDPTNGDCKRDSCDGNGNLVVVNDDMDLPPLDGNMCTIEGCNNGTPEVTDAAPGASCNNGNGVCNNMAMCVECIGNNDCGNGETCFMETCVSCTDGVMNGDETGVDCGGATCKKCNGDMCADGAECRSTFCVDGACCDNACSGACKSCGIDATKGTCTNIPLGMTDDAPVCGGMSVCDGNGACKLKNGEVCTMNTQCLSGNCSGGNPKTCQ